MTPEQIKAAEEAKKVAAKKAEEAAKLAKKEAEAKAKKAANESKDSASTITPVVGNKENHKEAKPAEGRTATWAEIQNVQRGLTLDGKKRVK